MLRLEASFGRHFAFDEVGSERDRCDGAIMAFVTLGVTALVEPIAAATQRFLTRCGVVCPVAEREWAWGR